VAVARASKPIIAAVALFAILAGPLVAGPLEDAEDAFRAGDKAKGLRLTRIAAEQGMAEAQYRLWLFFSNGQGVLQDYTQAARWFRAAAEQGHHEAQASLGAAYFFGLGVPQIYVEAHKWTNLAVSRAPDDVSRDVHLSLLETITQKMSSDQIAEAQKLARDWQPNKEH
jgi:hypothetical protein